MVFAHNYFFSYSSTAFVSSFPVFGYKYPAIKIPTPIIPTRNPAALKKDPIAKYPRRLMPIPTKSVITPPSAIIDGFFFSFIKNAQ